MHDSTREAAKHLARALALLAPKSAIDEETPARMAKALDEMLAGHHGDPSEHLCKTFRVRADHQELVVVRDISFASLCEHHVLPFAGYVSVGYIPDSRIVGLSKIPRMVHGYARRLQVQERLTSQVADAMERRLNARGVIVHIRGEHSCMRLRGVRSHGEMVTCAVRGVFKSKAEARAEALSLIGVGR